MIVTDKKHKDTISVSSNVNTMNQADAALLELNPLCLSASAAIQCHPLPCSIPECHRLPRIFRGMHPCFLDKRCNAATSKKKDEIDSSSRRVSITDF